MFEQTKRIAFRICSVSSKVKPEPDLHTGSDQKEPTPAPQHCWRQASALIVKNPRGRNIFIIYTRKPLKCDQIPACPYHDKQHSHCCCCTCHLLGSRRRPPPSLSSCQSHMPRTCLSRRFGSHSCLSPGFHSRRRWTGVLGSLADCSTHRHLRNSFSCLKKIAFQKRLKTV